MVIAAIEPRFLAIMDDPLLGFARVSVYNLLNHLTDTYAVVTIDDVTTNRDALLAPWNPDDPLEDLWVRISEARLFAEAASEPITELTAISLTLVVLEKTGVYSPGIADWRKRPEADWTLSNFKQDFNRVDKERLRILTATSAGFHGANAATPPTPPTPVSTPVSNPTTTTRATPHIVFPNGIRMYYCWTHGIGRNPNHTSASCMNKAEGHISNATADNPKGGNDRLIATQNLERQQNPRNT